MNLRIIAGQFGGRIIKAPDGRITHPMSDRVRGSLFNIINERLPGADVLDVFAGTGSLGLEALSRGANSASFVERDKIASRILQENIESLGVVDNAKSVKIGLSTWLDINQDKKFDIIFADPPYNDMQFSSVARLADVLKDEGLLVLSYPEKTQLPDFANLEKIDDRNYGTANLGFYIKEAS
ncbi:16S rRNA (guanine(966)-N(2))-methyltransferase RsmD [Candidatus Saccharibacteria bacterium]|nr:16S rRNA (guanine(966)-N(2))-methyltransferase RsmD [Candidatus Saccharibacteria bacterium]